MQFSKAVLLNNIFCFVIFAQGRGHWTKEEFGWVSLLKPMFFISKGLGV